MANAYRRAEVLAIVAVASDHGMGHPPDLALGAAALATGIGRAMKLSTDVLADTWAVTMPSIGMVPRTTGAAGTLRSRTWSVPGYCVRS